MLNTKNHSSKAVITIGILLLTITGLAYAAGGGTPSETSGPATRLDVILLIVYVLLALIVSFACSICEAVLLSITPSYIASLRETRPRTAALITRLKQENVDKSLAAILTLNTIAHTVGAIGSGAKASIVFGSAYFGAFSAIMTLMILFLSEIIPKTLGAVYWRRLAAPTARFVHLLILALYPLIYISELLTRFIARGNKVHGFSREEFVALATVGEDGGHLDESESRIIRNLFRLKTLRAADVMTPRTVIHGMPANTLIEDAVEQTRKWPFSRIPIFNENLDNIIGFALRDDILMAAAQDRSNRDLASLKRELTSHPESTPLSTLLEKMLEYREHIAIIVDEFGGTRGLVTLEDVVETLLGADIVDEVDRIENMQAYARRQWERRAKALGLEIQEPEADQSEPPSQTD